MLIVKELNGIINLGDISQSQSGGAQAGVLDLPWTPIGPGTDPVVSWDTDHTTYYLAFDYLGHIYGRLVDTTIWPPQIVDPVTYSPFYSVQEPAESLALGLISTSGYGLSYQETLWGVGKMLQTEEMVLDNVTGIFTTRVTRDYTVVPVAATLKKWRAYIRPLGSTSWTLLHDWATDFGVLTINGPGPLRVEVCCTYGHMWTDDGRNTDPDVSGDYIESMYGVPLVIDSTVQPHVIRYLVSDNPIVLGQTGLNTGTTTGSGGDNSGSGTSTGDTGGTGDSASGATSSAVTVTIFVAPHVASILKGTTLQFTATVGGTTNTDIIWSCTRGAIDATGLFTAPTTLGTYTVTAQSVADPTKTSSANITTTAVAPATQVVVSPASASLSPGDTQQFVATVLGGSTTEVNWGVTSNGGSISPSGLYTAPALAGLFTVKATLIANVGISGTAQVTDDGGASGVEFFPIGPNNSPSKARMDGRISFNTAEADDTWSVPTQGQHGLATIPPTFNSFFSPDTPGLTATGGNTGGPNGWGWGGNTLALLNVEHLVIGLTGPQNSGASSGPGTTTNLPATTPTPVPSGPGSSPGSLPTSTQGGSLGAGGSLGQVIPPEAAPGDTDTIYAAILGPNQTTSSIFLYS